MLFARDVLNICDNGQAELDNQWDLGYQWFGGNLQLMLTTDTSVP